MSTSLKFISILLSAIFTTSCVYHEAPKLEVLPLIMPVTPYETEFVLQRARDDVYQAVVELSQRSNLNGVTLDAKAGLLRFEQLALTPVDLDSYCKFPVVDSDTDRALSSFQAWNQQLINEGAISMMTGEIIISILLTKEGPDRTRVSMRSNWAAIFSGQKQPCTSRGVFESRLQRELRKSLGYAQ